MDMDLELYPFIPANREKWEALWEAAEEAFGEGHDLGYVGNDGDKAFFQKRGVAAKFSLSLDKVNA